MLDREQGSISQIYLCLLTGKAPLPRAQGSVPTQAQSLPPFQPQRPPYPTLARAEAIATGCFDPVGPRSKTLLLFSLPLLPSEAAGLVAWQKACLRLFALCLQGEGPSLDKVSFAMAQSPAFLTCRAWSCIGSCDTREFAPLLPVWCCPQSTISQVKCFLRGWLQAPASLSTSQGPGPRAQASACSGYLPALHPARHFVCPSSTWTLRR